MTPSAELVVDGAAADPVARLEHDRRVALALDLAGGGEPGEARADDRDVRRAGLLVTRVTVGLGRLGSGNVPSSVPAAPAAPVPSSRLREIPVALSCSLAIG